MRDIHLVCDCCRSAVQDVQHGSCRAMFGQLLGSASAHSLYTIGQGDLERQMLYVEHFLVNWKRKCMSEVMVTPFLSS